MTVAELQRYLLLHFLPDQIVRVDGRVLTPNMLTDGKYIDMVTESEADYLDRHPGKQDPREPYINRK